MRRLVVLPIRAYRLFVSPLLGPRCRFYPSCSAYAVDAVLQHGVLRGIGLAAWRLLRCNPWNLGGVDPVPPPRKGRRARTADLLVEPTAYGSEDGHSPAPPTSPQGA